MRNAGPWIPDQQHTFVFQFITFYIAYIFYFLLPLSDMYVGLQYFVVFCLSFYSVRQQIGKQFFIKLEDEKHNRSLVSNL